MTSNPGQESRSKDDPRRENRRTDHLKPGDPVAARAKAKEVHTAILSTLKAKLPNRVFQMLDHAPATYQPRYAKALAGKLSPKAAIRAHCEHCVGYEDAKRAVGKCTSYACPLHSYRPYQESNQ